LYIFEGSFHCFSFLLIILIHCATQYWDFINKIAKSNYISMTFSLVHNVESLKLYYRNNWRKSADMKLGFGLFDLVFRLSSDSNCDNCLCLDDSANKNDPVVAKSTSWLERSRLVLVGFTSENRPQIFVQKLEIRLSSNMDMMTQ